MFYYFFTLFLSVKSTSEKIVYKNGILQGPKHVEGTLFDKKNMWHLNNFLKTYPVPMPNQRVTSRVFRFDFFFQKSKF